MTESAGGTRRGRARESAVDHQAPSFRARGVAGNRAKQTRIIERSRGR